MSVPSSYVVPKYVCMSCRNEIPAPDLETVFHNRIKGFVDKVTVGPGEIELSLSFVPPTTVAQWPCTSPRSAPPGPA
jgi:hypothetical protein